MLDDTRRAYQARGFQAWTKPFRFSSEILNGNDPAAGGDGTPSVSVIAIDNDALFVWTGITAAGLDNDHPSYPSANMAIYARLTVLGPGYPLTGTIFIPYAATTGWGEAPHFFSMPMVLPPGERVQVEIVGLEEPFRNLIVTLLGGKLYTNPYTTKIFQADHDDPPIVLGKRGAA